MIDEKLQLEVLELETKKDLTENGKRIMRAIRLLLKGEKSQLGFIFKEIKRREDYIAELEMTAFAKAYQEDKLLSMITLLGECGIPITVKTLELLIKKVKTYE